MNTLFDNKYLTLKNITGEIPFTVYCSWKDFWEELDSDVLLALNVAMDYIQKNQIRVLISDCSELETIPMDVQNYINEKWYPVAQKHGLISEILVDSEHFMGKVTLEVLIADAKESSELIFTTVKTLAEAKELAQNILKKYQPVA